jgi:sulfur-carrier protein
VTAGPGVTVRLPAALAPVAGGAREVVVAMPDASCELAAVLDRLAAAHPALGRRLRDETGSLRGYVNVYVDGQDVRPSPMLAAPVTDGAVVDVVPSIAGG